jgi:hypothetical protein
MEFSTCSVVPLGPPFSCKFNRRGIGGNGFSLGCRLLYLLSYKEPLFGGPEAGFEPATHRVEVTVAFATDEFCCCWLFKIFHRGKSGTGLFCAVSRIELSRRSGAGVEPATPAAFATGALRH